MEPRELPHRQENTPSFWNQRPYGKHNPDSWTLNARNDEDIFFASKFDLSCVTIIGSVQNAGRRPPSKRNTRLFTDWTVKLNNENQLVVEGTLECGRRARSKPIAERFDASKVLSKFKHVYRLVGNIVDSQCELPGFVRHRFQSGFPEDWEIVVGIWKSFVSSGCNEARTSSSGLIIEKKLKLAIDNCADSDCFVELARKVTSVDNETCSMDVNLVREDIEEYRENGKQDKIIRNKKARKSIADYESQVNQRSETMRGVKQLAAWTPVLVPNATVKCCLAFKGTLLSSMGHAVGKNHITDAVHRRLSARIIETENQELYELIGDINNTKRDVPKDLVTWCRYGCPKQIHLFCEKWRMLKSDEMKFNKLSCHGKKRLDEDQGASLMSYHNNSANLIKNDRTNPFSMTQPVRKKNKRKRISIQESRDTSNDNDTAFDENLGSVTIINSRNREWPTKRGKILSNLSETSRKDKDIAKGENFEINQELPPTATHEKKQKLKPVPSLTYVYYKNTPLTESILSDGV